MFHSSLSNNIGRLVVLTVLAVNLLSCGWTATSGSLENGYEGACCFQMDSRR